MGYIIKDLLELPSIKDASKTVLGENQLNMEVSWGHILEVHHYIDELLDGKEMILTTDVGLLDIQAAADFLQQLNEANISCLVIEVLPVNLEVADWMAELVKNVSFPIIILHEIVRFIDITRECNTLIINKDNQLKTYVEKVNEIENA